MVLVLPYDDDDALVALGLPRALIYGSPAPSMTSVFASWSIFAYDDDDEAAAHDTTLMTAAALSMRLYALQTRGLVRALTVYPSTEAHVLLSASWQHTRKGDRAINAALDRMGRDDDSLYA